MRFSVSLLINLIIIYYEDCLFAYVVCVYNVDFWRLHFVVNRFWLLFLFVCLLIDCVCVCLCVYTHVCMSSISNNNQNINNSIFNCSITICIVPFSFQRARIVC